MLATAFSDLHAHNFKRFDKDGSRLENCLKVLDDVFKFSAKNKIRTILFCGDLADQQQAVPTIAGNAIMLRLSSLFEKYSDTNIIAITGNHDQGSKSLYHAPAVSFLTQMEIAFPSRFILIDNTFVQLGKTFVHGIPYLDYPEHFRMALQDRADQAKEQKGVNILMTHQTPSGLANPNIPIDTYADDELYDCFDLVINGHIHQSQKITDKFYILGSPLHRDLGDEGNEKGFWFLDLQEPKESITFVSRKGRYPEFRRVSGEVPAIYADDFIIPVFDMPNVVGSEAGQEEFNATLAPAELLENYWRAVDGVDSERLTVGLKFL